jgi:hypothetical protein
MLKAHKTQIAANVWLALLLFIEGDLGWSASPGAILSLQDQVSQAQAK